MYLGKNKEGEEEGNWVPCTMLVLIMGLLQSPHFAMSCRKLRAIELSKKDETARKMLEELGYVDNLATGAMWKEVNKVFTSQGKQGVVTFLRNRVMATETTMRERQLPSGDWASNIDAGLLNYVEKQFNPQFIEIKEENKPEESQQRRTLVVVNH